MKMIDLDPRCLALVSLLLTTRQFDDIFNDIF